MFNRHYTRAGLLSQYPGLDPKPSKALHPILQAATTESAKKQALDAVQAVYEANGFTPSLSEKMARGVVQMETRALRSRAKVRGFMEEEATRGKEFQYRVRDGDDFRTTVMSRWIQAQVPVGGLPLAGLLKVFDEAVSFAKRGAFKEGSGFGGARGEPCALPAWFRRRGWQVHYIDPREELYDVEERHVVRRVV